MKKINQYIIEKLKISRNNFKEYDWDEFVDLLKKYGKELYLDELCAKTNLKLNHGFIDGWSANPKYIYAEDNYVVLIAYNPLIGDIDKSLEDFLDIEKLFKGDDIIEKIINYIS